MANINDIVTFCWIMYSSLMIFIIIAWMYALMNSTREILHERHC